MYAHWLYLLYTLKTKKASEVLKAYIDHVYSQFGGSVKILSDNGTEFKNKLFEGVAKQLGVEYKIYTAPYTPQPNGRIEGFLYFLKACISKHISPTLEWDYVVPLACVAYNFFPNEHSKESPFFLMFGRDPNVPLTNLLQPKIRYLGTDENILSLESLKNIYELVATNVKYAWEKRDTSHIEYPKDIKPQELVLIKDHTAGPFAPTYVGNYRVVTLKGNQVEVMPATGGTTHMVHIRDVKYILPADNVISKLPNYDNFGRKTTLRLDPSKIPDLQWHLTSTLNTVPTPTTLTITTSQS